jgi:zinc transport system substrate-binding protein
MMLFRPSVNRLLLAVVVPLACAPADRQAAQESAGGHAAAAADGVLSVYVVNYPLQYFAERIGGDLVRVEFPAPTDVDPAYWTPGASAVAGYQSADIILLNGADYAHWVGRTTLPGSKLVNTSESVADRFIEVEGAVTHSHGPVGDHSHGAVAFTTWLDPTLAIEHARAVANAFSEAKPDDSAVFADGFAALEADLRALDERLARWATEARGTPLLGSHPVYQYLARRYDLNLVSVHFEPDQDPGEPAWRELEYLLRDHPAGWMLWESEPLTATSDRFRGLGIDAVVFDPCANAPESGDFLSVMRRNASNLETAFSG